MRHVIEEFDVFTFNELDPRAQERAREWYRSCMDCDDWDSESWRQSMTAFADHFGFHIADWELGDGRGAHIDANFDRLDDHIREMSGVRLWKWIDVQFGHRFILDAADGSCPFTGTYTDCALFDPLRDFVTRPDSRTFEELIRDCLDSHVIACRNAVEFAYSDEVIDESIIANEYEFTERGDRY